MEIFGHLQDRAFPDADLLAYALVARRTRLEVGDADHVVIAHGVGQMLGGGNRQRIAALRIVQRDGLVEPVQVFAAIGDVLKVDDLPQAAFGHVANRLRQRRNAGGQLAPPFQQSLRPADPRR